MSRIKDLEKLSSLREQEERFKYLTKLGSYSTTSTNYVGVTEEELMVIAQDVVMLLLEKNADHGDAWQKHGVAGVLVRISDKALRLQNLEGQEALVVDEKVEDTLRDIAGYALLGLLKERSKQ